MCRTGAAAAARGRRSIARIRATTPEELVSSSPYHYYCGAPLFEDSPSAGPDGLTFEAPDVYAKWQGTACDNILVKGSPAPADLDLSVTVSPRISRCEGATCSAFWETHTLSHTSYIP